ncbi:MAG: hypothetical protein Q9219_000706 [cf. Caloplaca sp. 3 TL-2023]
MDFATLMSSEISKKNQKISSPSTEPPKYLKRADVEAQRRQAYLDEQDALQREREAKIHQKRKREEEEAMRNRERDEKRRRMAKESRVRREEEEAQKERARRKRLGLPELPNKTPSAEASPMAGEDEEIPDGDLFAKLRSLNEPVTLFGETHKQRLRRYKRLITSLTAQSTSSSSSSGPISTTLDPVPESDMLVPSSLPPSNSPERIFLFRQLSSYFNMLLTEWSHALSSRPDSVKQSFQGKAALQAMQQSLSNLRPLFQKLETRTLEESILEPVVEIVRAAQERRYVDANDGYLRLSIGKAAWPIGVTMVGIHERSAREKLHESDKGQAHIMSDEVTRKFLQSIKRCLSFAQTRWPPEDQGQLMG